MTYLKIKDFKEKMKSFKKILVDEFSEAIQTNKRYYLNANEKKEKR